MQINSSIEKLAIFIKIYLLDSLKIRDENMLE